MPEPSCERFIAPPIVLPKSVPWVTVFVRLNASVAPAEPVIAPAAESAPLVPALPIWSRPASMVVAPE